MARTLKGPENQRHLYAFEIYYGMGNSRSLPAVAKEMGLSETAIRGWSRTFKWSGRVDKRDLEVAEQINKKAVKAAASRKIQYLDTIDKGMQKFKDGIDSGVIQVRSIADAEKLVNMYIKLIGETQVTNNVMVITASDIIKAEKKVKDGGGIIDIDISEYTVECGESDGRVAEEDTSTDNTGIDRHEAEQIDSGLQDEQGDGD